MKERAYAKINLCLDIVGKRDDGYHEMKMVMVPIDFYDVIDIVKAEEMSLKSNVKYLPATPKNTVIAMIELIKREYGIVDNFAVTMSKSIPTQAGLAGGSADGAAALRILNRMYHLGLSEERMIALCKQIGADVPFCCLNKPSVVRGIGDILEPFKVNLDFHILLAKPFKGVSTKAAFSKFDLASAIHPDCDGVAKALIEGDYYRMTSLMGNVLEKPSFELVPEILDIKNKMIALGMDGVLMSGSGSTIFGLTQDEKLLDFAAKEIKKSCSFIRKTKIYQKDGF